MPKVIYESDSILVTEAGVDLDQKKLDRFGYRAGAVERIRNFAKHVLAEAQRMGLTPAEATNGFLNLLCYMMTTIPDPADRARIVMDISEAITVATGGASDKGQFNKDKDA